jgi:hypothetical protein
MDGNWNPGTSAATRVADVLDFHKIINTEEKRRGSRPSAPRWSAS